MTWHWWTQTEEIASVCDLTPQLASWNKNSDRDQVRLREYRCHINAKLGSLPQDGNLGLHLEVDVGTPDRLLRRCDLENYLTPLFQGGCLDARRFVLVTGSKQVAGGSHLMIRRAEITTCAEGGWSFFGVAAGSGSSEKPWKERLRNNLARTQPVVVPAGPMEVQLAWRCNTSSRNWANLWKATCDAMGPVLGEPHANQPFNPNDDRIVSLGLHLLRDDSLGHNVDVAMWWKHLPSAR